MSTQSTPTDQKEVERIEALKASNTPTIRFVGDLQRLERQPGDVFVLSCDRPISDDAAQRLRTELMKMLPGAQVIVLGDGLKLNVVTLPDFEKSVTDVMVKAGVLVRPGADG